MLNEMKACLYNTKGYAVELMKCKTIDTVHEGKYPKMFDNWAAISLYLLLFQRAPWPVEVH